MNDITKPTAPSPLAGAPGSAGDALPCGCRDAMIRTHREFESMGDEDWPDIYAGFTCRCGKSFYAEPKRQNTRI